MNDASTINAIGHYCGRFAPGFFGEPLNSLSNIAFLLGAIYAWRVTRFNGGQDRWQLVLFALAASVGVGSFVFHSMPTSETLLADLVPIQIFGLALIGYVALRYLRLSPAVTVAMLIVFFFARQFWIAVSPRGALGGGITHIPALLLLVAVTFFVRRAGFPVWRYMASATVSYVAALFVRIWDLPVCSYFPWGVHWIWHLLTAMTASLLVLGIAAKPPNQRVEVVEKADSPSGLL